MPKWQCAPASPLSPMTGTEQNMKVYGPSLRWGGWPACISPWNYFQENPLKGDQEEKPGGSQ